jgi:hypothetical protein
MMFSSDAAMILRDIERQLQDATKSGRKPKEAFLLVLSQACLDLALGDWGGIDEADGISAIWDFVNKEMARVEAETEQRRERIEQFTAMAEVQDSLHYDTKALFEACVEDLTEKSIEAVFDGISAKMYVRSDGVLDIKPIQPEINKYFHNEVGVFENVAYSLTYDPDQYLYTIKIDWGMKAMTSPITVFEQDVYDSMDCRLFSHRLIATKIGIFPVTPAVPAEDEEEVEAVPGVPPLPGYPYGINPTNAQTITQPTDEAGNAAAEAPAPKSAETDDFLKGPSTLTKNILKDWGHL